MMSTDRLALRIVIGAVLALAMGVSSVRADVVGSFKDELFAYPGILEQADNGAFLKIDYDKMRDIHQRDEDPERRVKGKYVSTGVRWYQDFETIETSGRSVDVFEVGKLKTAKFAVIFVHGRGGDRKLGANDYSFGGNFNRLKNLAYKNRGIYYAPSARDFGDQGAADIAALISHVSVSAPQAKIVLTCASMGNFICWKIADDAGVSAKLAGMMILGGPANPNFLKSPAHAARLPIFFSHGSDDTVYPWSDQFAVYRKLIDEGYPTRFVLFQTGSHGTPIRMTDWRLTLNWILQ
jgi:pimeloyl-ACP methyl ester carboxylesterase